MNNQDKPKMPILRHKCADVNMDLEEALAWAREHMRPDQTWLLAEAPEKILWLRLDNLKNPLPAHCQKLLLCDANTELRLMQDYADNKSWCRLCEADPDAPPTYARFSACLLPSGGKLLFAEHFRPDNNSFLRLAFSRFCGMQG